MKKSIVLFTTLGFLMLLMSLMYISLAINEKIIASKLTLQNLVQTNYVLYDTLGVLKTVAKKWDITKNKEEFFASANTEFSMANSAISAHFSIMDLNNLYNINDSTQRQKFAEEANLLEQNVLEQLAKDRNITTNKQLQSIIIDYLANTKDENMEVASEQLYVGAPNTMRNGFLVVGNHTIAGLSATTKFYFNQDFNLTMWQSDVK